jgi:hypothetical protein
MPDDEILADGADDSQLVSDSSSDAHSDDDDPTPAPARAAHADGDDDDDPTIGSGPIPLTRHKQILQQTRRELEGRLTALSWADGYRQEQVDRAMQIAQYYDSNPAGLLDYLSTHLGKGQQADTRPPIAPEFETSDGVPLYAASQVTELLARQQAELNDSWGRTLDERVGPLEHMTRQQVMHASHAAQIQEAQTWPGFADHIQEITTVLTRANRAGTPMTLERAYLQTVLPLLAKDASALTTNAKRALLDQMNDTTDRAGDSVDPTRRAPASRKRDQDKSWGELIEEELAASGA